MMVWEEDSAQNVEPIAAHSVEYGTRIAGKQASQHHKLFAHCFKRYLIKSW